MKGALSFDLGLLILRVTTGGFMLFAHGLPKLLVFSEKASTFPDPLGIGNPASLASAIGAEFFCALLVLLGVGTRIAVLPLIFTMGIAAFVIHAEDPFQKKELALFYGLMYLVLFLTGGGRFSLGTRLGVLSKWS